MFITPDLCSDGHDTTCTDNARPGGYAGINAFLTKWVPMITSKPAYADGGLIITIFDEGSGGEAGFCCGEALGPTQTVLGGGQTGAVLLSPYIAPGTVSNTPYNHYSMLASVEDIFGLGRLGDAAGTTPFGSDVFTQPGGPSTGTTTTTSTSTTTTSTSTTRTAPVASPKPQGRVCSVPRLPRAAHGKLPARAFVRNVAVVRGPAGGRAITFTAVRAAKLRVVARTSKGSRQGVASLSAVPCRSYRFALPRGHGTVTIHATVPAGTATLSKRY